MKILLDYDKVVDAVMRHQSENTRLILNDIDEIEEEPVRCRDCKWWNGEKCLARSIDVVDIDDFCSYGERKRK